MGQAGISVMRARKVGRLNGKKVYRGFFVEMVLASVVDALATNWGFNISDRPL